MALQYISFIHMYIYLPKFWFLQPSKNCNFFAGEQNQFSGMYVDSNRMAPSWDPWWNRLHHPGVGWGYFCWSVRSDAVQGSVVDFVENLPSQADGAGWFVGWLLGWLISWSWMIGWLLLVAWLTSWLMDGRLLGVDHWWMDGCSLHWLMDGWMILSH